jgi:hypothetical protein
MSADDRVAAVWRSVHVHRYARQDEFLVDAVAPVLAPLRARGAVSGFFFLRYWKGGHHLRLRMRVAPTDAEQVLGEVTAELRDHLARSPAGQDFDVAAFREAQGTMAALEDEQPDEVQPPDTIRAARYLPEHDKYGGPRGTELAEAFFERSSDAVLRALPAVQGRSSRRLGVGFSTMLRGLSGAGLTPAAMADFFADYCMLWSPYVFDEFLVTWPDLLRERGGPLHRHTAAVLAHPGVLALDPVAAAVRTAWAAVTAAEPELLAAVTVAGADAPAPRRRQVLLASYLHTHNNRLGLIPEQEAFLGYLGHHVLSACADRPADADLMAKLSHHRARRLATA